MSISEQQYNDIIRKPAIAARNKVGGEEKAAQPECPVRNEPLAEAKREASNSSRFRVCVEGRRVRLCDPDNLAAKYFVDCCRYAGLIPDDSAAVIDFHVTQTKVKSKEEECTVITIEPLL